MLLRQILAFICLVALPAESWGQVLYNGGGRIHNGPAPIASRIGLSSTGLIVSIRADSTNHDRVLVGALGSLVGTLVGTGAVMALQFSDDDEGAIIPVAFVLATGSVLGTALGTSLTYGPPRPVSETLLPAALAVLPAGLAAGLMAAATDVLPAIVLTYNVTQGAIAAAILGP